MKGRAVVSETCQRIQLKKAGLRDAPKNSTRHEDHAMERVLKEGRSSQLSDSFSPQIGRDPTFLTENSCEFDRARMRRKDLIYPSCAENPAVQGGDVERGERSSPKLNSVSAAARCTGG